MAGRAKTLSSGTSLTPDEPRRPIIRDLALERALRAGDIVTFAESRKWWKRALVWLRVLKRPALRQFVRPTATGWRNDAR
jgi:hypothetical protein